MEPTTELAKIVTTEVVKALLAPYLKGAGERFQKRVEEFFKRFPSILPTLDRIPDRILVPALQEIAVLDDETLQSMWATLLENSAKNNNNDINSAFVSILKQMSGDEAVLLKAIHGTRDTSRVSIHELTILECELKWDVGNTTSRIIFSTRFLAFLDSLESKQLVRRAYMPTAERDGVNDEPLSFQYQLTVLGGSFLEACTLPLSEVKP